MRSLFLTFIFCIVAGAAFADRPLNVVYKKTTARNFKGQWAKHPHQVYTTVKTHPGSSTQTQKISYATKDDVSKYRFFHPHLVYKNFWGYFFPPGTKAVPNNGAVIFKSPNGYMAGGQK